MLVFDSSVEDNKLCTNIECLEGILKHIANQHIRYLIFASIGYINYNTPANMMFQLSSSGSGTFG